MIDPEGATVRRARLAGLLYLIIILGAGSSEMLVRSALVVGGDPAATAANISGAWGLYRFGFAADLVAFVSDVALAGLLYLMLRAVNPTVALIALSLRLVQSAVLGANLAFPLGAAVLLGGFGATPVADPATAQGFALALLEMHKYGYNVALVFFGVHCLLLGWLFWRSGLVPRLIGGLLVAGGVGYLVDCFTSFLAPQWHPNVVPVLVAPVLGEVSICLWLLIRGVRLRTAPAAA